MRTKATIKYLPMLLAVAALSTVATAPAAAGTASLTRIFNVKVFRRAELPIHAPPISTATRRTASYGPSAAELRSFERSALEHAVANPHLGTAQAVVMRDKRFLDADGWIKVKQFVPHPAPRVPAAYAPRTEVHYNVNPATRELADPKVVRTVQREFIIANRVVRDRR